MILLVHRNKYYGIIDEGVELYDDDNGDACQIEYLEVLRHCIEEAYDKSKNVLNKLCPNSVRSQQKATGWLTIIFTFAKGEFLQNGKHCDMALFVNVPFSPCDLFVEMKINGKYEYSTKVIEGDTVVEFFEMYQSKRISKHQQYELRLMDKNDVGDDELLFNTNGQISELIMSS